MRKINQWARGSGGLICAKVCIITFLIMANAHSVTITRADLENKTKGGWIGKCIGVAIGAPTEFQAQNVMYTGSMDTALTNTSVKGVGSGQDDLQVQAFLAPVLHTAVASSRSVFAPTMRDYGDLFKTIDIQLWHGNLNAFDNLNNGLNPPYSGMWAGTNHRNNEHADDIDFQIESDWIGFAFPGMPNAASRLCDTVGHVIGYADGVNGGRFVSACIAIAFFEDSAHHVVHQALGVLPQGSQYRDIIQDVLDNHDKGLTYNQNWTDINNRYRTLNDNCPHSSASWEGPTFNIMASFNGALIALGLAYGNNDAKKTIAYAIRGGQDSDCNGATAGAIIGVIRGADYLRSVSMRWTSRIAALEDGTDPNWGGNNQNYTTMTNNSIADANKAILEMGGSYNSGTQIYTINQQTPSQPKWLEVYGAEPILNSGYTSTIKPLAKNLSIQRNSDEKLMYDIRGRHVALSSNSRISETRQILLSQSNQAQHAFLLIR